jgi:peptidoglycan hydrolase CwlO-like protein
VSALEKEEKQLKARKKSTEASLAKIGKEKAAQDKTVAKLKAELAYVPN